MADYPSVLSLHRTLIWQSNVAYFSSTGGIFRSWDDPLLRLADYPSSVVLEKTVYYVRGYRYTLTGHNTITILTELFMLYPGSRKVIKFCHTSAGFYLALMFQGRIYLQLRARRALLFNDVPLRTRRGANRCTKFMAIAPFWFSMNIIE